MEKVLYVTHLSGLRVNRFWLSSIRAAHELGMEFHLACNMRGAERAYWDRDCQKYGIIAHHIDFDRNPLAVQNKDAYKQMVSLLQKEAFDIIHCNTPIGGVVTRMAAKTTKVKHVIYEAHGFHFWKGAPLKNWLCYYPVERFLAHYTDRLITINQEDFACAQRFHYRKGGHAEYVPGVGIDIDKVRNVLCDREQKRVELGIATHARVYVTVAELIPRKGYETLLRAFQKADLPNAELLICGTGAQEDALKRLTKELGIGHKVRFLGFRVDIFEILKAADVFVFPSKQEGLPVALMEAMAAGLPCVASRIRGNVDLLEGSQLLFDPRDVQGLSDALMKALDHTVAAKEIERNQQRVQSFSLGNAVKAMKRIYVDVMAEMASKK